MTSFARRWELSPKEDSKGLKSCGSHPGETPPLRRPPQLPVMNSLPKEDCAESGGDPLGEERQNCRYTSIAFRLSPSLGLSSFFRKVLVPPKTAYGGPHLALCRSITSLPHFSQSGPVGL